jgi:hypothetical protein
MKIMILHHHHSRSYYDVSSPEIEAKSYLAAFKFMDEDYGSYSDIEERVDEVKTWTEETEELREILESGKIPKALHMDKNGIEKKIDSLLRDIENARDEVELYGKCKVGDVKAIKEFMKARSDEGAESEDLEFAKIEEV